MCFAYPGDETVVHADQMLLSIEDCLFAEPDGIDALLHVLGFVHRRFVPIASVTLSE